MRKHHSLKSDSIILLKPALHHFARQHFLKFGHLDILYFKNFMEKIAAKMCIKCTLKSFILHICWSQSKRGTQCKTSKESCQFDLRQYLRPQCLAWEGGKNNAAPWCATTIPDDSQAQALLKTFCRMDRNSIVCFGVFF